MKKLLLLTGLVGVLASCVEHPERRKVASQFKKRIVRQLNSSIVMPMDLDTIYKPGDTTWVLKNDIYIVVVR